MQVELALAVAQQDHAAAIQAAGRPGNPAGARCAGFVCVPRPARLSVPADEREHGWERRISDRPGPVRDDRGLPGAAAAQHPGPADWLRAAAPAVQPPARRADASGPGDRRPGGAGGTRVTRAVPEPASAIGQTLARMQAVDRSFDPAGFLDGAEKAFRMIVAAFAAGDRTTLRNLLSDDTYRAFEQAIAAREAAGHRRSAKSAQSPAQIEDAELRGTVGPRDRAVRLRPDQPDAGQGRQPRRRHRRGDRDHRSLDFRAGSVDARSDLAAGLRAQRLMRPRRRASGRAGAGRLRRSARPAPPPAPAPAPAMTLTAVPFSAVPGWREDHLSAAIPPLQRECAKLADLPDDAALGGDGAAAQLGGTAGQWRPLCAAAAALPPGDDAAARAVLEQALQPYAVSGSGQPQGLFTGYYEPQVDGAMQRGGRYQTPLLGRPRDLVQADLGAFATDLKGRSIAGRVADGRLVPYYDRAQIERGALAAQHLAVLYLADPIDAFFLEIQGSGRVRLPTAGSSGSPMTARTAAPMSRSAAC